MTYSQLWEGSQKERIMFLLRQRPQGVCGTNFLDLRMPRYAARIKELRDGGHTIKRIECPYATHTHTKAVATYRLEEA